MGRAKFTNGWRRTAPAAIRRWRPKPFPGRLRKLSERYADTLRELNKSDPRQLNFNDALWTLEMIRELIASKFGVQVSVRSVSNILRRFGIAVRRPGLKAYQQDPQAVNPWLEKMWPTIRREAKATKAMMYFDDKSSIRSDYHRGTTWGVRGQTPVVEKTGRRFSVNLIAALSTRGELRLMVTERHLTTPVFIGFPIRPSPRLPAHVK